jgi:chromosomal replication initiation ATPase DnaA
VVRELEGGLIRLAAYASLSMRRIDLDSAQETLGAAITRPRGCCEPASRG